MRNVDRGTLGNSEQQRVKLKYKTQMKKADCSWGTFTFPKGPDAKPGQNASSVENTKYQEPLISLHGTA